MLIYYLYHTHVMKNGELDNKGIGYYTSYDTACEKVVHYKTLQGFCEQPENFHVEIIDLNSDLSDLYELWYIDDRDPWEEIEIICGYYTTLESALVARDRLKDLRPYKKYLDGFGIDRIELNRDWWEDGYTTKRDIMCKEKRIKKNKKKRKKDTKK